MFLRDLNIPKSILKKINEPIKKKSKIVTMTELFPINLEKINRNYFNPKLKQ